MSDVETHEQRAKRGREIIAQVRELETRDKALYEAFAETVQSKNKKYVHRRPRAAAMIAEAINTAYSVEQLRRSNCPFVVISKVALYCDEDLRQRSEDILNSAPIRRGTPDRRRNPIRETV